MSIKYKKILQILYCILVQIILIQQKDNNFNVELSYDVDKDVPFV